MQVPRWRNVLVLKNSLIPAFLHSKQTATAATNHVASFHSTPVTSEKWRNKFNFDDGTQSSQQPSKNYKYEEQQKNYIRYTVRQKRADAKRALKDLLLNNGSPNIPYEDENPLWKFDGTEDLDSDGSDKKRRPKFSRRHAKKSTHNKAKRRFKRERFSEDFDHPESETIFRATFGNKTYTWSSTGDSSFQSSESGFEWRENSGWTNQRTKFWETISDVESESEDESYDVGSCSDRTILGLPPRGPLKLEDVKNAFRSSALKWHPDKHQGPSQAMAEEKFKLCVNAYKSLCTALA